MEENDFKLESVDQYKKASLLLFTLNESDQQWVFKNLPTDQVNKLKTLLSELVSMGLNPDDEILKEVLNNTNNNLLSKERSLSLALEDKVDQLNQCNHLDIGTVLADEPPEVIAMALSVENWTWASQFLASLSPKVREGVRESINHYLGKLPDSVQASIVEHMLKLIHAEKSIELR